MKKIIAAFLVVTMIFSMTAMIAFADTTPIDIFSYNNQISSNPGSYFIPLGVNQKIEYKVNFLNAPSAVTMTADTSSTSGGVVELYLDSAAGELLATFDFKANAPSSWGRTEITQPLNVQFKGERSVWLVCRRGQHDFTGISFDFPSATYTKFVDSDSVKGIENSPYRTEINTLADLGIYTAETINEKELSSKGMLIEALANFYEKDEFPVRNDQLFADVNTDNPLYKEVSVLCTAGVLVPDVKANLGLKQGVTLDDACELICRMLNLAYMHNDGTDYKLIAKRAGIVDSSMMKNSQALVNQDIMALLYNTLTCDYMKFQSVAEGEMKFEKRQNILEKTRSIYMNTGVVEANSAISLVSNSNFSSENNVIIDGEVFNIGKTVAEEFVGFKCTYFYTGEGSVKTLVAIRPETKVEYGVLNSNDVEFTRIDDDLISYYAGDNKKEIEIKLGKNTTILYNGRLLETKLTEAIGTDEFQGELLVIDNDHNGIYDVILVDHAITLIYGGSGLNEATKTYSVYDKLRDKHFDIPDFDKVYLLNGDKPTSWKSIPVGAVMDYYVSKNATGEKMYRMCASDKSIEGVVRAVYNDKEFIMEDGKKIEAYELTVQELVPGQWYSLNLNGFGKYVSVSKTIETQLGVVLGATTEDYGRYTKSLIKILTQDSKVKIFYFNNVAIIDGNRYKDVEEMGQTVKAIGTLTGAYTGVAGEKRLGVRFRLNEEEKIVMIDTPKTGEPGMSGYVESEDQLTLLKPEGSNNLVGNYILQVPGYNTVCAFKSDAKFATIYPDADDSVHTFSNTVTRGESMKTVAYTTNKNSLLSDFIIWNRDYIPMLNCIVVTHISQSLNEDGDIVYTIGGYGPKGYDERMVNSKVYGDSGEFEKKLESLKIGDVVNYALNAENEICNLSIRYKGGDDVVSNEGLYTTQLEPHYTQYDNGVGKYTLTKIIDRVDNVIKVEKTPGLYEYIDVSSVKYISCEKGSKEYVVTPDDNKTELGMGKTVLIVVPASSYIPNLIVSYQ